MTVRLAIPNKGRLSTGAHEIVQRLRPGSVAGGERELRWDGAGLDLLRANCWDIPRWVEGRQADLGITGLDIVRELSLPLDVALDLGFGRCRLVLAAPEGSRIEDVASVPDDPIVATSYPRIVRAYFESRGRTVRIVELRGAAEVAPALGVAALVADLVETGSTLRSNGLRPLDVILESRAVLVVRRPAEDEATAGEVARTVDAFAAVTRAGRRRFLFASAPSWAVDQVRRTVDDPPRATLLGISSVGERAVLQATVEVASLDRVLVDLRSRGASEIVVVPIDRWVV